METRESTAFEAFKLAAIRVKVAETTRDIAVKAYMEALKALSDACTEAPGNYLPDSDNQ